MNLWRKNLYNWNHKRGAINTYPCQYTHTFHNIHVLNVAELFFVIMYVPSVASSKTEMVPKSRHRHTKSSCDMSLRVSCSVSSLMLSSAAVYDTHAVSFIMELNGLADWPKCSNKSARQTCGNCYIWQLIPDSGLFRFSGRMCHGNRTWM